MLLAERLSRENGRAIRFQAYIMAERMALDYGAFEHAIEAAHKAIGCPDPAQAVLMQTRALGDLRLLLPRESGEAGDPA